MPRGENRHSFLLTREENEQVFSLIGPKCQSLVTAVVQLFTTDGPAHSEWRKKDTGVLCLIKDNGKRSYFFRIYCLYRKAMIWEHEVYMQIEYKDPRPYLHTFEAEEYMTAFNFANVEEARLLKNILIEKIELRKCRREERRQRSMMAARANSAGAPARHNGMLPPPPVPEPEPEPEPEPAPEPAPVPFYPPKTPLSSAGSNYTLKRSGKKKLPRLTKADIGMPKDFKHISHVGIDVNKVLEMDNVPNEELRSFFSMAGVSATQLQDDDTREFIYDFIETHGGLEAVKEDLHEAKPAGRGARAPPVPQRCAAHPPAPPSRAPPPPPARAVPPPPAAPRNPPPPRPAQPPTSAPPSVPPPPPPGCAPPPPAPTAPAPPPPPPPPPAPPAAPPPPPAPPMPADEAGPPTAPDPRAALMESIRSGSKSLKRVEVAAKPPQTEDNRSNLLSEIRQGIELKAVSRSTSSSGSSPRRGAGAGAGGGAAACGLAGALARALEERSRAIHSDSDDDLSDATTSDGEWDD